MKTRWMAGLLALAVSAGLLFTGAPAVHASSKGRLNTTMLLGAATAYSLLKGKTTQGLLLGAGTYYAYTRYRGAKRAERRRNAYLTRAYRPRYHRHYRYR